MTLSDRLLHVFHWPTGYPIRLLLPAMLVLSLGLHALGFYFFRSGAPARVPRLAPSAPHLVLYAEDSGPARSLVLAARDPSWMQPGRLRADVLPPLAAGPPRQRALEPDLPGFLTAAPLAPQETWIPSLPPLAVRAWLEPARPAPDAAQPRVLQPTAARFDRGQPQPDNEFLARLRAATPATLPGRPTELFVRLDAAGEARNVWILRGCGDAEADLAAVRAVQQSRFGAGGAGYEGVLRVVWGAGAAEEKK